MTIIPFLIDNILNVYNKTIKLTAEKTEKDLEYPQDIVSISTSAQKLIKENLKKEEIEKIRQVK
jgi:hypothetical protein